MPCRHFALIAYFFADIVVMTNAVAARPRWACFVKNPRRKRTRNPTAKDRLPPEGSRPGAITGERLGAARSSCEEIAQGGVEHARRRTPAMPASQVPGRRLHLVRLDTATRTA